MDTTWQVSLNLLVKVSYRTKYTVKFQLCKKKIKLHQICVYVTIYIYKHERKVSKRHQLGLQLGPEKSVAQRRAKGTCLPFMLIYRFGYDMLFFSFITTRLSKCYCVIQHLLIDISKIKAKKKLTLKILKICFVHEVQQSSRVQENKLGYSLLALETMWHLTRIAN